ncbi:MAG: tyrosine-type recombinase/integrase, partial [Nitrososphaerales archaeon]
APYTDESIKTYLDAMSNLSKNTFRCANDRLTLLPLFVKSKYNVKVDALIESIRHGKQDRYNVLTAYTGWLKHEQKKSDNRVRTLVKTFRQVLEFNDLEISQRTFALKVKLPRKITRVKTPVDIHEIRAVLQSAKDIKLRTFLMTIAATGVRPIEASSILHKHIDLKSNPPRITIRAEYTKMRVERYVYLTQELAKQISLYLDYKLRQRWQDNGDGKQVKVVPINRPNDLLFAPYRRDASQPTVNSIYIRLLINTEQLLDTIGKNERIGNGEVRKFHFYSMRRFAKSTISDLGYGDFSEWMLGHSGSPYYEQSEKDRAEVWRKVEPYLTFLDVSAIEARQRDIESELEATKDTLNEQVGLYYNENQALKDFIAELARKTGVKVPKELLED